MDLLLAKLEIARFGERQLSSRAQRADWTLEVLRLKEILFLAYGEGAIPQSKYRGQRNREELAESRMKSLGSDAVQGLIIHNFWLCS